MNHLGSNLKLPASTKKEIQNFPERQTLDPPHIPKNWTKMDENYDLKPEDRANGLKDLLYNARDTAAHAVGNLLSSIGVNRNHYQHIYNIPIGLENKSNSSGIYDPGIYDIVVGRESDDINDFLANVNSDHTRTQHRLAITLAHEMIHATQTIPSPFLSDGFDTIGGVITDWRGLEEGMAEALGNIAVKMALSGWSLNETAAELEDFCAENDLPATQMSARLIHQVEPKMLNWYLTRSNLNEIKHYNLLQQAFGSDYPTFCQNMTALYDHECYENLSRHEKRSLVNRTTEIIDHATAPNNQTMTQIA